MIDPTAPQEPESAPEVLITPQQQYDIVAAHKARPPEAPITRDSVITTVRDILNRVTFNGWPMSFDGGNITVSPAAMDSAPSAVRRSQAPSQPVQPPQFRVTLASPRVPVVFASESAVARPAVPQASILPPLVPAAPAITPPEVTVVKTASDEVPGAKPIVPPAMSGIPVSTSLDQAYSQRSAVSHKRTLDPTVGKRDPHHPHDSTMTGETLIPIRLKRADGQRTVLAFIDAPTSYVLDGATMGERILALPATDKFYDAGGGGGTLTPFSITTKLDSGTLKALVNQFSYIFNANMLGGVYSITSFASLFSPAIGDYAYLEISQDNTGTITDIQLKMDAGWAALPKFYTVDSTDPINPFVDSFYLPIAKFVDPSSAAPGETISIGDPATPTLLKVVQGCTTNLLLVLRALDGLVGWTFESYGAIIL